MDTTPNRKALDLIRQLGAGKDLTARFDPPRVGSKRRSLSTVESIRLTFTATRELIHRGLFLFKRDTMLCYLLDHSPGIGVEALVPTKVEFRLLWPEDPATHAPFHPGTPYEIWGRLDPLEVFCEDGMMPL